MNLEWYTGLEWFQKTEKLKRILFICSGNVARSVSAEYFFNHNPHIRWWSSLHAISRGINTNKIRMQLRKLGVNPDFLVTEPEVVKVLGEGLRSELANRIAENVTKKDIKQATLVLTLEKYMRDLLRMQYPQFAYKIFTLKGFADANDDKKNNLDIADCFVDFDKRPPGGPTPAEMYKSDLAKQPWSREYQWWYINYIKKYLALLEFIHIYIDRLVEILGVLKGMK